MGDVNLELSKRGHADHGRENTLSPGNSKLRRSDWLQGPASSQKLSVSPRSDKETLGRGELEAIDDVREAVSTELRAILPRPTRRDFLQSHEIWLGASYRLELTLAPRSPSASADVP